MESVLRSTPEHTLLKYMCPMKISNGIRLADLKAWTLLQTEAMVGWVIFQLLDVWGLVFMVSCFLIAGEATISNVGWGSCFDGTQEPAGKEAWALQTSSRWDRFSGMGKVNTATGWYHKTSPWFQRFVNTASQLHHDSKADSFNWFCWWSSLILERHQCREVSI